MDMSDLDALLDDLGSTYRKPSPSVSAQSRISKAPDNSRVTRGDSVGKSGKMDMSDLDDLIHEWEAPPQSRQSQPPLKAPDPIISLDLESELNALTDDLQVNVQPMVHEPAYVSVSKPKKNESDALDELQAELNSFSDESHSPKRRTQILEAHGQKKNPLLDNMLKDLTSASKNFENPAEAIPINPKIGASPKATVNKVKKEVPPVSEPPKQAPVHPVNVPKFTPTRAAETSSSTLLGARAKRPGCCPTCGLNLKAKPGAGVINAVGAEWHKECFSCNFCKKILQQKTNLCYSRRRFTIISVLFKCQN
eukprot:TRINITY_DN4432_c0_g1_i1.p1 TRINITY_DN4432_c0_g1~~TRINITY_DN4432_c0_g1_i1.p1  ORF type:complete len:308 (+),score=46.16 TRINITY_DN4432_c0_g1_i1:63-986(+)